jgi:biotin carboxylase
MVLGAGAGQLGLIRKAVQLGLHVITVDNVPDNPGHRLSHTPVHCSTVDRGGVLQHARRLGVSGIATFASDVATPTVAYVAEQLGLRGCSVATAETMSDKAKFRRLQHTSPLLAAPGVVSAQGFHEIFIAASSLTPPVVFKPSDTSGSRGISRVDSSTRTAWRRAFDLAQRFSRSGTVCVEEFVAGIDTSGDGFLKGGRLFAILTKKRKNGFVPTGHSLPTDLPRRDLARIFEEVEANCAAAGYTDGPIDFDVSVAPNRVVVIEMSPRLGGNGIPALVERATGVDLFTMTIRWALGEEVELPVDASIMLPCGSWVFGSPEGGFIRGLASPAEVRSAVPECFDCTLLHKRGTVAPDFSHSGNALGWALFDCPPGTTYARVVERIASALRLDIVPAAAHSASA